MVDPHNPPRPAPKVSEDGVPATSEINEEILLTGDPLEGELPPLDRLQGAATWGTTAAEQLASEPLDVRLAREVPEPGLDENGEAYGDVDRQFLEPGAAEGFADDEADVLGEMEAGLVDTLSPEEAAMRVVDEPPGMNYDPDPGYVDQQEIG